MAGDPGARPSSEDWTPPAEFDGFKVVRPLGRGGMGHVYLGHDPMLDRAVALKFIAADDPAASARERFLVEARAIARLQHPNIVGIFRIGEVLGRPYIAYELIDGLGVDRVVKPASWQRALAIGLGVARGLAAAHRRDVLHRDVKPSNIILADTGEVKLIDFGLAKLIEPDQEGRLSDAGDTAAPAALEGAVDTGEAVTLRAPNAPPQITMAATPAPSARAAIGAGQALTITGALLGTPLYIAPELWTGSPATKQSDVYALGLVLYELLAGRLPFADLRGGDLVRAALSGDLPPLASICPEAPMAFTDLVDRCVRRRREERCRSADEVCEALAVIQSIYQPFSSRPGAASLVSDDEAERVAASFARVASLGEPLAIRMYERLFALDATTRQLFPDDMSKLRMKLMGALRVVVENLRRPERVIPLLEDLGKRHAAFGVRPAHFESVGEALLGALAELDGATWGPVTERAWKHAYAQVAEAMKRGLIGDEATLSPVSPIDAVSEEDSNTDVPRTRYTRSGDVNLAYQVVGRGPVDLLLLQGWVTHLDAAWQWPGYARLLRRLGAFARVITFDRRGTGLSDRVARTAARLDDQVADARAVLDAAGSDRAVVFGVSEGAALAALLAARAPDRVRALVMYGGGARRTSAPDFVAGVDPAVIDEEARAIEERWGEPLFLDTIAPSLAKDPAFRRFWAAYLRAGAGPAGAIDLLRADAALDARSALAEVRAPALVLHRARDERAPALGAIYVAGEIKGARLEEVAGEDHLVFAGPAGAIADAIERFVGEAVKR